MCLKVARLFGGTPELWMRLQAVYDLKIATGDLFVRVTPSTLP
jgi:plasmid maintenance system antidote protein VapI